MKITTLVLLFLLGTSSILIGQDPVASRVQRHEDQTALEANKLQMQDLQEKQLRLVEAISDGDLESADIMKQEVLQLMDLKIGAGESWTAKNEKQSALTPALDRMKAIRENLARFSADSPSPEKAQEAGNMVTEFLALMGRVAF